MLSYGLVLKEMNGQYFLLNKVENHKESLLTKLKEPLKLTFTVFCTDSLLLNYSSITVEDMNQGYYLSNKNTTDNALSRQMQVSEDDKVFLITGYGTLANYIATEDAIITCTRSESNEIFYNGTFKNFKQTYSFNDLLTFGSFNLVQTNTSAVPLKCIAVEPSSGKIFGVIELFVDADTLNANVPAYTVTIGSKEVFWRYYIVNRESLQYKEFKLFAGKNNIPLQQVNETILSTGEKAYILEIADPILMKEQYDALYEIEFLKVDAKTGQSFSKKKIHVPVPDKSKIKIARNANNYKAYSDMYVYL
jgi:hypothetical protein